MIDERVMLLFKRTSKGCQSVLTGVSGSSNKENATGKNKPRQHYTYWTMSRKADQLGSIRQNIAHSSREVILAIYSALVRYI